MTESDPKISRKGSRLVVVANDGEAVGELPNGLADRDALDRAARALLAKYLRP